MIHKWFCSPILSCFKSFSLILRFCIILKNRVESTFTCLYFFMSHILHLWCIFTKWLFCSFVFLVHVHLCFPGVQVCLIVLENHQAVSINIYFIKKKLNQSLKVKNLSCLHRSHQTVILLRWCSSFLEPLKIKNFIQRRSLVRIMVR